MPRAKANAQSSETTPVAQQIAAAAAVPLAAVPVQPAAPQLSDTYAAFSAQELLAAAVIKLEAQHKSSPAKLDVELAMAHSRSAFRALTGCATA